MMKKANFSISFFIVLSFLMSNFVTPFLNDTLFKIGRSKDANEIFYSTNFIQKGKLNEEEPISVFWIKRTNGNKKEALT